MRQAHAECYVALGEKAGPGLRGGDQLAWARGLAVEIGNFRAALDWAVERELPEYALRLVAPLAIHGIEVGYAAMDWAAVAAAIPGADRHPLFGTVASWAAWGATSAGDYERARGLLEDVAVVEEGRGTRGAAFCRAAATLAFFTGDVEAAHRYAEEWVAVARAQGDPYEVSQALVMQASAVQFTERGAFIPIYEEAVQIARDANIPSALATGLAMLATSFSFADPLEPETAQRAITLAEEAIEVGTMIGDHTSVLASTATQGLIALRQGEWRNALEAFVDATTPLAAVSGPFVNPVPLLFGATLAFAGLGHFEPAAVLLGVTDRLAPARFGPGWEMSMLTELDAALPQALGPKQVSILRGKGAALGQREALEYLRVEAAKAFARVEPPQGPQHH